MTDPVATPKTNKESGSKERLRNLPLLTPAATSPTLRKEDTWRPGVQRHVDKSGALLFSSLRVRILSGDVERNYSIQFKDSPLNVRTVCAAIARKEGIPSETAKYFRLWIVGKDLELQLGDEQVVDTIIAEWPSRMLQYTHYPEAKHQKHPINRYWFVYRHKSGLSKLETLRVLSNEASLRMLYGEVKRNVLTNRYLFLDSDCVMKLGALQLHIMYGNCESSISEMLRSKKEVFESIIPIGAACSLALMSEIISTYKSLSGITESDARKKFIQVCQSSPLFGSSYFVACEERPPLGFFEYRVQKWLVAVNEGGLFAIDTKFKKIIFALPWPVLKWKFNETEFFIQVISDQTKSRRILSPQSPLIHQSAVRCEQKWVKGFPYESEPLPPLDALVSVEPNGASFQPGSHSKSTGAKFTRVDPAQSHQKQKSPSTKVSIKDRLKSLIRRSNAGHAKKPADSIFDLDRGMVGLGSERRLNVAP